LNRQSFVAGTSILIGASLVTRVLGFVYRIAITRLIGAEGIGLFQMVFPILGLLLTIVTAGTGVAVSKMVAESLVTGDRGRIRRVLRISLFATGILSSGMTAALILFGHAIAARVFTDPRAYVPFSTLTPLIGIIAVSSVLRGYFQGLQIMSTPSVASILETAVRIVGVFIIASMSLAKGLEFAAAGISAGMILGELVGCLYMYAVYRRKADVGKLKLPPAQAPLERRRDTIRALLQIALPVTFSRFVGSIAYAVEPLLVTRSLLAAGLSSAVATKMYGEYGGMVVPLLIFPTVFTYSLAVQLVPSVSEALASGRRESVSRRLNQSFRVTAIIGFPTSLILTLFATPLCAAIYHEPRVGPLLALTAPCGFLLYLQAPLSGILQGINRAGLAMRNSLIGAGVKLAIIYLFARRPEIGITGVAWSLVAAVTLTTLLHIRSVHKLTGFYVDVRDTVKILLATGLMGLSMHALWRLVAPDMHLVPALLLTLGAGLFLYSVILLMTRTVTSRMLGRIPGVGRALARLARALPFAR
jgi:stage V sporulation protein B